MIKFPEKTKKININQIKRSEKYSKKNYWLLIKGKNKTEIKIKSKLRKTKFSPRKKRTSR